MEPADTPIRYKLIIGKYPVVQIEREADGLACALQFPAGIKFVFKGIPPMADLREGDLLTLYTEVLLAKPNPTSIS